MSFNPDLCRNESEVESKLIVQYLLPALGYSPDEWHQEVAVGSIRLDFLAFAAQVIPFVLDANSPLSIVMEAKHPKQNLNNHTRRLKHYLICLNVRYGLLTNGRQIRIFERLHNDIQLIFQCNGKDIAERLPEVQLLIGRDSLRQRQVSTPIQNPNSVAQLTTYPFDSNLEKESLMKTIAVYHNKGGVGKTTISINLAAALRRRGKRVLLIDLDSQANTTFAAGLIKFQFEEEDNLRDQNVYHLLESGEFNFIPDIVRKSHFFNNPEIDVIPAHINLIEGQYKLNQISSSRIRLISKLNRVEGSYDIVIIDTPPSRDLYAQIAMMAADYLIIPSDLKPFANQGLSSVKSFISETNESREAIGKFPISIMGVLPSKILTNPRYREYTLPKQMAAITDHYKLPLMKTIISDRTDLSHCLNKTITVGDMEIPDPKSIFDYADQTSSAHPAAEEFESLAKEVLNKMEMI